MAQESKVVSLTASTTRDRRAIAFAVVTVIGLGWLAAAAGPARATWSIVAVDPETGEVGGGIASCVDLDPAFFDDDGVLVPLALVPGVGVGVSQAEINLDAPERIAADLKAGDTATATIEDLTGAFDPSAATRQHAVVRLDDPGSPAAFTGAQNNPWAGDRSAVGVSAQGNTLVSESVVADTLAAYEGTGDAPLAERLARGLLAGSKVGGDSRCGEQTALFAHVAVVTRDGDVTARTVKVKVGDGRNPVELLALEETSQPAAASSDSTSWWRLVSGATVVAAAVGGILLLVRRRRRGGAA